MTYDPNGKDRGTGRTTRQMRDAPENACFVWCNNRADYARRLAERLERRDLKVVTPNDLIGAERGRRFIVVDHAASLPAAVMAQIAENNRRVS